MLRAIYYDGKTADRREIEITIAGGQIIIAGAGIARREPLSSLNISERLGGTPRLLRFADGACCEVRDHAALEAALGAAGHRIGLIERLQHSWRAAALAVLLSLVAVFAAYRWGLPLAAEAVALRLPPAVNRQLGETTLSTLDRFWLQPSQLDPARRRALAAGFAKLRPPDAAVPVVTIEFRSSRALGANAFALPGGRIILLDALVKLAHNDDEIYAVLAHEQGHVRYRHGLRLLLQSSAVALAMTAWIGDVSTLLATLPTAVLQTRYSRAFEAQADDYAAHMLLANGIAPSHLADLLERLMASRGGKGGADGSRVAAYLSTHPATAERIRRLRAADAAKKD